MQIILSGPLGSLSLFYSFENRRPFKLVLGAWSVLHIKLLVVNRHHKNRVCYIHCFDMDLPKNKTNKTYSIAHGLILPYFHRHDIIDIFYY